ncbi:hypothetical protein IMG5_114760 [Ichthyophthirius multifiliis]|uniref:Uncharacterized protein n=1 Tax=Ichthyophthirius multifiliis TaxID=5932 RepID=G0QU43_ICHMU|nr:hypothetical protein IMG5_114760 [Ichthyophthirius multifiliis]EGR31267.1 hypothetical protein IMG5_114760 [Ichthyophthirius multifiliis]|eukprot:XP_004034753.1 hypothetical protein IMG5_114760 [Ichthyophthirius multifiliis]
MIAFQNFNQLLKYILFLNLRLYIKKDNKVMPYLQLKMGNSGYFLIFVFFQLTQIKKEYKKRSLWMKNKMNIQNEYDGFNLKNYEEFCENPTGVLAKKGETKKQVMQKISNILIRSTIEINSDLVDSLTGFQCFGIQEIIYNKPRQTSVICKSQQGEIIQIKIKDMLLIASESPILKLLIIQKMMMTQKQNNQTNFNAEINILNQTGNQAKQYSFDLLNRNSNELKNTESNSNTFQSQRSSQNQNEKKKINSNDERNLIKKDYIIQKKNKKLEDDLQLKLPQIPINKLNMSMNFAQNNKQGNKKQQADHQDYRQLSSNCSQNESYFQQLLQSKRQINF